MARCRSASSSQQTPQSYICSTPFPLQPSRKERNSVSPFYAHFHFYEVYVEIVLHIMYHKYLSTYFDHLAWSLFSRPLRFYYIIFIQFRRVYVLNGYMHYITSAHSCPFSPWIFSYKSTFQSEALVIEQGLMSF